MSQGDADVLLDVVDGVATITMNQPERRNRLDFAGMQRMRSLFESLGDEDEIRAIVLTGSGTTFCSGADLAAASSADGPTPGTLHALGALLAAILDCPKPTIARVGGHVAGGGNGLVAACDLAVAARDARFAFSEVRLGVAPAVISVVCLAVMHRRDAQELLLTGERVSAHRAQEAGLVTCVVDPEALDAKVADYVQQLTSGGPQALAMTKELLRRVPQLPRAEAFAWTADLSANLFGSAEAAEGMAAFLGKRTANWVPRPPD